jgi:hypothetical protein
MFLPTSWSREEGIEARALLEAVVPGEATTSCEAEEEVSLEASPTDRDTVASSRSTRLHCDYFCIYPYFLVLKKL